MAMFMKTLVTWNEIVRECKLHLFHGPPPRLSLHLELYDCYILDWKNNALPLHYDMSATDTCMYVCINFDLKGLQIICHSFYHQLQTCAMVILDEYSCNSLQSLCCKRSQVMVSRNTNPSYKTSSLDEIEDTSFLHFKLP